MGRRPPALDSLQYSAWHVVMALECFEQEAKQSLKQTNMIMKTNDLSDSKFGLPSALALALIGWMCWNGGTLTEAQSPPATQSPQLQEVVKLTQAKMSDDVILAYIKNSGATYNLSADDILYLNNQGVSQPVISALLAAKGTGAPAPVAQPTTPAPAPAPVATAPAPVVSPYPNTAPPVAVAPEPEAPPPGSEISLSYFQAQLAPYGSWIDVPGYGPCFLPTVESAVPDWRPYFNGGHWIYTDDGWSWQSDYPWGQYVFHYGRWFRDPRLGWMWKPGYHWGPGWVCWRYDEGDGYTGWAPLPPGARFEPGVGLMWDGHVAVDADFGLGPDAFVFIPFDHFWENDYMGWRAPLWRTSVLFRGSLVSNHYGFVGGRFVVFGLGRERMGLLTRHEIRADHLIIHDQHIAHDFMRGPVIDIHIGGGHDEHGHVDHGHDDHGHDDHHHDDHGLFH